MSWCLKIVVLLAPYVCFHIWVWVTEWPPIGKTAAHSAYDMFSGLPDCYFPPRFLEWESFSGIAFS